jgi:hypothetical protein
MLLKMYPNRDFRHLINQTNASQDSLICALRREPLAEVLWYWNESGKPLDLLNVYQKGIEEAIAKDRYPLYQLEDISLYPEFFEATLNGLKRLWITLRFSLRDQTLLIDSINGRTLQVAPEDKLKILQSLPYDSVVSNQAGQIYKCFESFSHKN